MISWTVTGEIGVVVMSEKLYCEVPHGKRAFNCSELRDAKFAIRRTSKPDCKFTPKMEWYCTSEECVVREVQISCKLLDIEDKVPKSVKCPVCSGSLEFHGFIEYDTLLRRIDTCT